MKHIVVLLEKLYKQGIAISVKDGELKIKAEKSIVTSKILEEIKSNKQDILSFLEKKQAQLSFAQERLWFIDQYNHNATYSIPAGIRVLGELNIDTLERTLVEI